MLLYLIRHTSVAVPRGTCYGWTDVPVSENFEAEAAACKQQLDGIRFDRVYTSPLTRARQLAAYCGYADAIVEPRMKEMHMGDWEMQRFDEITDPQLREYYENYLDSPTRNGESFQDLYRRVASFIEELKAEDARLASVADASASEAFASSTTASEVPDASASASEASDALPPQRRIAIFCHGGPIICAMVYAGLVPLEQGYANIPDYASVTRLEL